MRLHGLPRASIASLPRHGTARCSRLTATLAASLFLSGCVTPYLGYTHLSDPAVNNDGWDMVCGGVKKRYKQVEGRAAWCQNVHLHNQQVMLGIEVDLIGE